jgi:hypothetical protein
MSEQPPKVENPESFSTEIFPYPKLVQTFNYFFPKEDGAPDIFTMKNLKKFAPYAPFLTLGLLILVLASILRDCLWAEESVRFATYICTDTLLFLVIFIEYLYWLWVSLFAKIVRRSPSIPLVMSFFNPLRAFGWLCMTHFFGFIIGGLANLAQ